MSIFTWVKSFWKKPAQPARKKAYPSLSLDLCDMLTMYAFEYVRKFGEQGDTPDGALCEVVDFVPPDYDEEPGAIFTRLDRAIDAGILALSARVGRKPSGVGITPFQRLGVKTMRAMLFETLPVKHT